VRQPLDRSDSSEGLDRATFVHGGVDLDDAVEVDGVVEDASVDAAFEDVVEQVGDVSPHWGYAAAPDVGDFVAFEMRSSAVSVRMARRQVSGSESLETKS
jgi:hypothetical protein